MRHDIITTGIQNKYSLSYARLETFILDITPKFTTQERPLIVVCPGGAYTFTSEREAEIVALQFTAMGYHAAVLYYSCAPAGFPASVGELASSVALLRAQAREWKIDPDRIAVLGFSAGAHLAATLGVYWNSEWLSEVLREAEAVGTGTVSDLPGDSACNIRQGVLKDMHGDIHGDMHGDIHGDIRRNIRPNGLILAYPVITAGRYTHEASMQALLGERSQDPQWRDRMSLERHVNENVPPVFMWHTSYDDAVPIRNSLLFAGAVAEYKIPLEYHVFPGDRHGMSLADWRTESEARGAGTCACQWIPLVHTWLEGWRKHETR